MSIAAEPVWSQPGPTGSWWCGAVIAGLDYVAQQEWRQLVDSVAPGAS
jgi:hypothetical protein